MIISHSYFLLSSAQPRPARHRGNLANSVFYGNCPHILIHFIRTSIISAADKSNLCSAVVGAPPPAIMPGLMWRQVYQRITETSKGANILGIFCTLLPEIGVFMLLQPPFILPHFCRRIASGPPIHHSDPSSLPQNVSHSSFGLLFTFWIKPHHLEAKIHQAGRLHFKYILNIHVRQ